MCFSLFTLVLGWVPTVFGGKSQVPCHPCSRAPPLSKHLGESGSWAVPACRIAMDTSLLCLNCSGPANLWGTNSQAHLSVMSLNKAKCNLGKVNLEQMRSAVSPSLAYMTCWGISGGVLCLVTCFALGHFTCWSLRINCFADRCGSISVDYQPFPVLCLSGS